MNCRRTTRLLSAYIDAELTGTEQIEVRHHMRECCSCRSEYESLLKMKRMLAGLAPKEPRPSLEVAILAELDAIPAPATGISGLLTGLRYLAAYRTKVRLAGSLAIGAVAVMVLSVSLTLTSPGRSNDRLALTSAKDPIERAPRASDISRERDIEFVLTSPDAPRLVSDESVTLESFRAVPPVRPHAQVHPRP